MLLEFRVKNYKSFAEEAVLDMRATTFREHPNYVIEKNNVKVLPVAAIYGANASGKSNLVSAYIAMINMVVNSNKYKEKELFPVASFTFEKNRKEKPSEFEVYFNVEDYEFKYGFVLNKEEILEEWLYYKPFNKTTIAEFKPLFERNKSAINLKGEFEKGKSYVDMLNKKTLLLTLFGIKKIWIAENIVNFFIKSDFDQFYEEEILGNIGSMHMLKTLHDNKKFLEKMKQRMQKIDSCIKDLIIIKYEDGNQNELYRMETVHVSPNKKEEYRFIFDGESTGTKKLFCLYYRLEIAFLMGGKLLVDELDINIHSLAIKDVIKEFHDKKINKNNAQLIFTMHDLILLNREDLRRDEIWFVEKDEMGKSSVYSLADFKNVRSDLDYNKAYLAGKFGAIPFNKEV